MRPVLSWGGTGLDHPGDRVGVEEMSCQVVWSLDVVSRLSTCGAVVVVRVERRKKRSRTMTLSACPVPPVVIVKDKTEDGERPDPGKRRRRREGLNVSQTRGAGNRRASVAANARQAPS